MMHSVRRRTAVLVTAQTVVVVGLLLAACSGGSRGPLVSPPATGAATSASPGGGTASTSASPTGDLPVAASGSASASADADGTAVYAHAGPGMLTAETRKARSMVYVPNTIDNTVDEIDPSTFAIVRRLRVGAVPQHVVPSWDLTTLWVNDNKGNTLIPIDPVTGQAGRPVPVEDPYNLYFTPDGAHALVMAERDQRIDVRDAHTMALQRSLPVPCRGVNHADYTADLTKLLVSCEFSGKLLVIPADASRILQVIDLNAQQVAGGTSAAAHGGPAHNVDAGVKSMPQDVRLTPDGRTFLAADMLANGVWEIDATTFTVRTLIRTGAGAHGIYPSRDGRSMYVTNRDAGSISVLEAATLRQTALWTIPGGGSPDMGGVSADGKTLWLSGRSHAVVYVFDTTTGAVIRKIPTEAGPHGLCVWPQPGRFSLGHTGNMR
ncbi:MAG TPA: YncE family protein [Kineosporiaceae bacterium]